MALDKNADYMPYLIGRLTAIVEHVVGLTPNEQIKAQEQPLSVLPSLLRKYHSSGSHFREEELQEIIGKFPEGANFPARLTLTEQSGQILGYFHERADISKEVNRMKIAKKVKLKRTELDMTQAQLAEKAGVTTPTIIKIESGDYNVSLDVLSAVMAALGVKMRIEDC